MKITKKDLRTKWIQGCAWGQVPIFPPITPWINNDLEDKIVAYLLESNTDALRTDIGNIHHQITAIETKPFLTPLEMRQIKKLRNDIAEIEAKMKAAPDDTKLRHDVKRLSLIRGVKEIRVTNIGIFFKTCPIIIEKIVLGWFEFHFKKGHRAPSNAFSLRRGDREWYQTAFHPHHHGNACYGDFGPVMQRMLEKKQYATVFGVFMNFLAIYDKSSPLIHLESIADENQFSFD